MKHKILFSVIAAAPLLVGIPAQATELVLAAESIGDLSVPEFQTNWASNPAMDDQVHFTAEPDPQGPMSFLQFNPTLGTLDSVKITVSGAFIGIMTAQNQSSATTSTTIESPASLDVTMTIDIFNDYDGDFQNNDELIEFDGYDPVAGLFPHANYVGALKMSALWDDPPLPVTLDPGEQVQDTDVSGASGDIMATFNAAYAQFDQFIGIGTFDVGCSALSEDNFTTSGGSPLTGHEANAMCMAQITYNYTEDSTPPDVPAPAPLALIGLGLFGLAAARRQRKS